MEFFIPKTGSISVGAGRPVRLVRGIQDLPDAVADSQAAIAYGIKTVDEMSDAEWRSIGRKKPTLNGAVKKVVGVPALDGVVRAVSGVPAA